MRTVDARSCSGTRKEVANGTTANEVNWLTATTAAPAPNLARLALLGHNEWLENILSDSAPGSYAAKVIRNRPVSLRDACWDAAGVSYHRSPQVDWAAPGPGAEGSPPEAPKD